MDEKKTRRKRGERKDGRIAVTFTDGMRPDGKPNRIFFYGRTRKEAEEKRDEYKRKKETGMRTDAGKTTLSDWIAFWFENYTIKVNTAPIRKLEKALGNRYISTITEADLVKFIKTSYGDKAKGTVLAAQALLKRCFEAARRNRLIIGNPAEDLPLPSGLTDGTHRVLEQWEIKAILAHPYCHPAYLWAVLMLFAGLRIGEAIALTWDKIDLEKRTITVNVHYVRENNRSSIVDGTKTPAGIRVIPICSQLLSILSQVPEAERNGLVCHTKTGKPVTTTSYHSSFRKYCQTLSSILSYEQGHEVVFQCRCHDLRHTFATAMYDAGIDIKAAMYYMGHTDISTTQNIYIHLSKEKEKESMTKLVTFLDNWLVEAPGRQEVVPEKSQVKQAGMP